MSTAQQADTVSWVSVLGVYQHLYLWISHNCSVVTLYVSPFLTKRGMSCNLCMHVQASSAFFRGVNSFLLTHCRSMYIMYPHPLPRFDIAKSTLFPHLIELINDEELCVQSAAIEALLDLVAFLDKATVINDIVLLLRRYCEKALGLMNPDTIVSLSRMLGRICHTLKGRCIYTLPTVYRNLVLVQNKI